MFKFIHLFFVLFQIVYFLLLLFSYYGRILLVFTKHTLLERLNLFDEYFKHLFDLMGALKLLSLDSLGMSRERGG
jgi:hypothetical protein